MTAHPAAYFRRSFVDPESPGDVSREAQRETVRKLAAKDGHNGNIVEYDDWGVSADVAKAGKRIAYSRLLGDMEAGKVSAVYAFDVDRLYRDPRDLIRLQDAAQRHDVRIVTTSGTLAVGEGDDPSAEAFAFIGAVFGRLELQKAKKRARASRAVRVARGDHMAAPPYGWRHEKQPDGRIGLVRNPAQPVEPVLDAYREAGSVLGACGVLEARGIPAPKGGKRWATSLVTRILEREAPGLLPRKSGSNGRRTPPSGATLARLIRCPFCEKMLTPNQQRGQLYCSNGARDRAGHPRYVVREADLMPWIRAEADRYTLPESVETIHDTSGLRADLEARMERATELYIAGDIGRDRYDQERAEIAARVEDLEEASVEDVGPIDWDNTPPAELNALLRAYWREIRLDSTMRPVEADWRIARMRSHSSVGSTTA